MNQPNLMPHEHREAVLGVIERILLENEGNRITTALRVGILVSAQRLIPAAPPDAGAKLKKMMGLPDDARVEVKLSDKPGEPAGDLAQEFAQFAGLAKDGTAGQT